MNMNLLRNRRYKLLLLGVIVSITLYVVSHPCLLIETEQGVLTSRWASSGDTFCLSYTHSVQKTPVRENFVVNSNGELKLVSTEYKSFGVGLPFLASDGTFTMKQDRFVLEDINRIFPTVRLRVGPEAKLVLEYAGETIPLYAMLAPGSFVQIRVGPYYSRWLK
jgi:hypothetical protein